MSVKIKIIDSPAVAVAVRVSQPEWREFLYY